MPVADYASAIYCQPDQYLREEWIDRNKKNEKAHHVGLGHSLSTHETLEEASSKFVKSLEQLVLK